MSKYLIETQEIYRVNTDSEANELINEAKNNGDYVLKKYDCVAKEVKSKGEVIDEWYRVTLRKSFTDEKEPFCKVSVNYEKEEPNYGTF